MAGGKAAVAVITEQFKHFFDEVVARGGHRGTRTVVLPYPIINRSNDELVEIAHDSYERMRATIAVDAVS